MRTILYLHSSKSTNHTKAEELGLSEEATSMFRHACCEVEVEVEINEETGEAVIVNFDGNELDKIKKYDKLITVIHDVVRSINKEIAFYTNRKNVGKKGCIGRLMNLLYQMEQE